MENSVSSEIAENNYSFQYENYFLFSETALQINDFAFTNLAFEDKFPFWLFIFILLLTGSSSILLSDITLKEQLLIEFKEQEIMFLFYTQFS